MAELGPGGREQLVHPAGMFVHRPAHIQKQKDLDGVVTLGAGAQVDVAPLGAGADGAGQVQFLIGAVAGPFAQPAQRDLDVAGAKLDPVIEIAELAAIPDLDRAAVSAVLLADAHAFGVVAMRAEGRGAGGADPLVAALVAFLLFGQPLAQAAHQLVEAAGGLDRGALLGGQQPLGEAFEPRGGDLRLRDQRLDRDGLEPREGFGEGAVEAVEMRLVLDQRGAGEVVEPLGRPVRQPRLHPAQQVEIFPQAGRHPVATQAVEERAEHQPIRDRMTVANRPSTVSASAWASAYCIRSARLPPSRRARAQPITAPRRKAARTIMPPGIAPPGRAVERDGRAGMGAGVSAGIGAALPLERRGSRV